MDFLLTSTVSHKPLCVCLICSNCGLSLSCHTEVSLSLWWWLTGSESVRFFGMSTAVSSAAVGRLTVSSADSFIIHFSVWLLLTVSSVLVSTEERETLQECSLLPHFSTGVFISASLWFDPPDVTDIVSLSQSCSPYLPHECDGNSYPNGICFQFNSDLQAVSNFTVDYQGLTRHRNQLIQTLLVLNAL